MSCLRSCGMTYIRTIGAKWQLGEKYPCGQSTFQVKNLKPAVKYYGKTNIEVFRCCFISLLYSKNCRYTWTKNFWIVHFASMLLFLCWFFKVSVWPNISFHWLVLNKRLTNVPFFLVFKRSRIIYLFMKSLWKCFK